MTRTLTAMTLALSLVGGTAGVLSAPMLVEDTAWARAGGGSSGGSRGSRGFSAPSRPSSPTPASPSRQAAPPSDVGRTTPQRGWGGGLMGGLAGFALGGLLGSMLFGGMGHGFGGGFGGFGLLEMLIVGGLAYMAFSYFRRRRAAESAIGGGYGATASGYASSYGRTEAPSGSPMGWTATPPAAQAPSDLEAGTSHIRQWDPTFDPGAMAANASDIFFKIQAAWTARDMKAVRELLTPEMYDRLDGQCAELRAQRRINRLENIAVRSAEVSEAWQESGQDFVTVAFLANVLDYTTDEAGQVTDGSRSEPTRFEEFWTFVRPVGPNRWKLTAIQQAG
jgi:predicted lipid-binding transport protein (Tim44 family)